MEKGSIWSFGMCIFFHDKNLYILICVWRKGTIMWFESNLMRVIEAELHVEIQRLEFENPSRAWMIFDEYSNYPTLIVKSIKQLFWIKPWQSITWNQKGGDTEYRKGLNWWDFFKKHQNESSKIFFLFSGVKLNFQRPNTSRREDRNTGNR